MTDNPETSGGAGTTEPDGKFTDEEFADGTHTSERAASNAEGGGYTDSELSETDKDRAERHD